MHSSNRLSIIVVFINNFINPQSKKMKKTITVLAVLALATFTMTSCKKDYVCKCTEPTGITNANFQIENVSKDDANSACDTYSATYALVGGSCALD